MNSLLHSRGSRGRSPLSLLLLICSIASACGSQEADPVVQYDGTPPNLVLITLDTTRADHLGPYGYFRDTTPELDKFAAESLMFERCIAPMATTLPTHLSMLTGTYPIEHGVMANSIPGGLQYVVSEALSSLATTLSGAGYHTGGFVSGSPLNKGSGAARGYDSFGQPTSKDRRSEETVGEALEWMEKIHDQPFHLWVHMFDAHWPFQPPAEYQGLFETDEGLEQFITERGIHGDAVRPLLEVRENSRAVTNAYDGALRYQDAQFGRLLDALRSRNDWDRTVVVVIGDHGEGLGQHGEAAHRHIWDEQLRVPLFVRIPKWRTGVSDVTLSTVDVLPTVLAQLDLPFAADLRKQASGRNVLHPNFQPAPVFSQETGRSREMTSYRFTLTDKRWKYVRIEERDGGYAEHLFDLRADPYELQDQALRRPKITEQFRAGLIRVRRLQKARARQLHKNGEAETRAIDAQTQRDLRALGYVDEGDKEDGHEDESRDE